MGSEQITKEMQIFQASVKRLGTEVGRASNLWKDTKFSELSSSVSEVAAQSKNVMVAADRCCASIDRFEKIAAEQY